MNAKQKETHISYSKTRSPPGKTRASREKQLVSLAIDLAEEQLRSGTATAQVLTHFLRLATVKSKLELEKIRRESALLLAKRDALDSVQRIEILYKNALDAMRSYRGEDVEEPGRD